MPPLAAGATAPERSFGSLEGGSGSQGKSKTLNRVNSPHG